MEEEDTSQYVDVLLEEFNDQLSELRLSLNRLSNYTSNDKNPFEAFFRVTHTLKGNAAFMGIDGLAEVSKILCEVYRELDYQEGKELGIDRFSKRVYLALYFYKTAIERGESPSVDRFEALLTDAKYLLNQRNRSLS